MTESTSPALSVLRHLKPAELQPSIQQETRSRERHLPPVSVYRWWARRTETVTGAIVDAVSADEPGRLVLADVFAGGGVIALAGLLRGHTLYAQDINPWAAQSLTTMLSLPEAEAISEAGKDLHDRVAPLLAKAYATKLSDGTPGLIAHTLRVASGSCPKCENNITLYPRSLVSLTKRVDTGGTEGWMACVAGHLNLSSATKRTSCATCDRYIKPAATYTTDRQVACPHCRWKGKYHQLNDGTGLDWTPVLVERAGGGRREISAPTAAELKQATTGWAPTTSLGPIADGIETAVLLRHGITQWHELYPARQRAVIEELISVHHHVSDGEPAVADALKAAILGSTEMAGLASRWDARYLKQYETIANHRFNFTTLTCEPNVWGTPETGRGTVSRRLSHLAKASIWLDEKIGRPLNVEGPVPAATRRHHIRRGTDVRVVVGGSQRICLPDGSVDAVITDPPYHDDVHYGELSDLFRAWNGSATGAIAGDAIVRRTSSDTDGDVAYQALLTELFTEMARALKPTGHVVLSYANRYPAAWVALFNALQGAGFRTIGYTVIQSENETDHAKTGRRACTMDVLIDLVKADRTSIRCHQPRDEPAGDEDEFCRIVGNWGLRVGALEDGWETEFESQVKATSFLGRLTVPPSR